jgi:hypothetical protein
VLPSILIVVGGVLLLQNMGVLPANSWTTLWRLWPLAVVLIGLDLLFGRRGGFLAALLGLAFAALALGIIVGASGWPGTPGRPAVSRSDTQVLRGATQGAVTVRFGAGQLDVGPLLNGGTDQLARMTYDGPSEMAPETQYAVTGGIGRLTYQASGRSGPPFMPFFGRRDGGASRMVVSLTPSVPLNLIVQTGAAEARLDLSQLRVGSLDLSMGAANTWVRLPEAAGTTSVHISGGAASLTLEVPNTVAAQIRARGGLNTLNVDQSRFPAVGDDTYRSPNYDSGPNRVDVTIETGVATIRVS